MVRFPQKPLQFVFKTIYWIWNTLWGGAPNKYLDKIDKCIKDSMCKMLFKNRYDNVKPFFKHLKNSY